MSEAKPRLTDSGIVVEPLYTQDSISSVDPNTDIGVPGGAPYTRGIYQIGRAHV